LERLRRIREVNVRWLSYELRPEKQLTPAEERNMAAYKRKVDANWPNVQAMAHSHGLEFGPRNPNTRSRLALEAAKFAEDAGAADAYVEALFRAHFVEGRDLSDPAVLAEIAGALYIPSVRDGAAPSGRGALVDASALRQALDQRTLKTRVDRELALGFMYKLSGVPAFIIGNKYLVVGAQPLETLVDVVDKCAGG
jgi:predicted DsbA family dithiol-disulfide isomerase